MKRPAEDNLEDGAAPSCSKTTKTSRLMQGRTGEKHSLDSDEEEGVDEEEEGPGWMEQNNDGEEAETLREDGDIPITPFNLKEEKSEGDFTKDGDFVWKKKDEIQDSWLDSVDWNTIHEKSRAEKERKEADDAKEDELEADYDEIKAYKGIIDIIKPAESVAMALRRLEEELEAKANKELMLKLTGFADSILSRSGNMEVYEETYEGITFKLKSKSTHIPVDMDADAALDMFASAADEKTNESETVVTTSSSNGPHASNGHKDPLNQEEEVKWEFKWNEKDDSEIHGPHSSKEMLEWQESGFFENGVFVRKVGSSSSFSSSKRIDFDLYV
ncbi:CD2BP2 [Lepeophtheirus salmonis]|uniref:CD2BP2 n=1 Tax=Lepeophtheirus salmonis TaxID=72036 RepID=A0A7R8CKB3_LEPSM|nr:CD2BP2 [Lepeophtheirus salmonis]CAF2847591.1 CD2BP2 [Lepeophtheirus salmonis]